MKKLNLSVKGVAALMSATLLMGGAIGGTLAWLSAESDEVTNTFASADIGTLELEESTGTTYTATPGVDLSKDPKVTYTAPTEDAVDVYVFVEVIPGTGWAVSDNVYTYDILEEKDADDNVTVPACDDALKFTINTNTTTGWTRLQDDVYYRTVAKDTVIDMAYVIQGDTTYANGVVEVSENLVKSNITKLDDVDITFKAYAIQQEGFGTVADAWAAAK